MFGHPTGMCWRCARCDWVDCYSAEDLAEYGAPTECQANYHESLVEISLPDGWAALADKAADEVRKAERALEDAKSEAATAEQNLALAIAHNHSPSSQTGPEQPYDPT